MDSKQQEKILAEIGTSLKAAADGAVDSIKKLEDAVKAVEQARIPIEKTIIEVDPSELPEEPKPLPFTYVTEHTGLNRHRRRAQAAKQRKEKRNGKTK